MSEKNILSRGDTFDKMNDLTGPNEVRRAVAWASLDKSDAALRDQLATALKALKEQEGECNKMEAERDEARTQLEIMTANEAGTIVALRAQLAEHPDTKRQGIYVASRASQPRLPEMWKSLRSEGWPIISTWIDEPGAGETESMVELWMRIVAEVRSSEAVVFYADPESFPLRGAYVEVGIALAFGIPVFAIVRNKANVGSWINHPLVEICEEFPSLSDLRVAMAQTQEKPE